MMVDEIFDVVNFILNGNWFFLLACAQVLSLTAGHCFYSVDLARQLAYSLENVIATCGSVRISFSRRTPQKVARTMQHCIVHREFIH